MAIDVFCDCGKRLKAPDWMAGRSTQCPSCWQAVRIPKRRWIDIFAGSRKNKRRRSRTRPDETGSQPADAPQPANSSSPTRSAFSDATLPSAGTFTPVSKRSPAPADRKTTFVPSRQVSDGDEYRPNSIMLRSQPRWVKLLPARKEQRWYHSLSFPLVKLPVFFRLGLLEAVLTTAALIFWLSMERDNPLREQLVMFLVACLGGVFFVLGHTFHYFNAILEMACHGQTKHEPDIGCTSLGALVSCGHWLSCFLAGPVLFFAAAFGYWLYCGDLTIVDWSILAELCFAGVGWWLIALLLTNLDDTVRVASPIQVVRTAFTMPWECAGLTIMAAVVFLGHFFAAAYAIGQLHVAPMTAFPLLWICWSSGFYLTAFTFRRLGLTYYRAQKRIQAQRHARVRSAAAGMSRPGRLLDDGPREPSPLV